MEKIESKKVVINGIFKEKICEHNFPNNSPFSPDFKSYTGTRVLNLTWNDLVSTGEKSNDQDISLSKIKLIREMEKFILDGLLKGDTIGNIGYKSNVINTGNKSSAFAEKFRSVTINSGDRSLASSSGPRTVAVNSGNESIARVKESPNSIASAVGDFSISICASSPGSISACSGNMSAAVSEKDKSVSACTGSNSIAEALDIKSSAITTGNLAMSVTRENGSSALTFGHNSISMSEGYILYLLAWGMGHVLVLREPIVSLLVLVKEVVCQVELDPGWY